MKVLPISPKAYAALSRRVLQAILTRHGYAGRDLAKHIDAVLNQSRMQDWRSPATFDNTESTRFASSAIYPPTPFTDQTNLQVINVRAQIGRARVWKSMDGVLDHYYVRPALPLANIGRLIWTPNRLQPENLLASNRPYTRSLFGPFINACRRKSLSRTGRKGRGLEALTYGNQSP